MTEETEQLRDQLHRIIEVDSMRDSRLRGKTAWHRLPEDAPPNWLAWREAEGGREILMYNNALCDPVYVAFEPSADGGNPL